MMEPAQDWHRDTRRVVGTPRLHLTLQVQGQLLAQE